MSTWSITYKTDTYAAGEDWDVGDEKGGGVEGLHAVTGRLADLERSHGDGSVKGPHTQGIAIVRFPLFTAKNITDAAAILLADSLKLTWELIRDGSLEPLTITLADRTYSMLGAPASGFDVKLSSLKSGYASAFCPFTVYDAQIT